MTMLGAIGLDGLRGFLTIESATDTEVFLAFVTHQLCPNLRPGNLVVMDNLSAHKNAAVQELIEARGADVLFLPPYSPDLNPIEKLWGKLKDIVRRSATRSRDAFDCAVAHALGTITTANIRAWTHHAGYTVTST
jgi:transposase